MAVRTVGSYELLEKLGSGLQGKVYKARSLDGEIVALKLIDQDAVRASPKVFLNLQREITAMERLAAHPHVVCVKKVELDVNKPRKRRPGVFRKQIMIVMELATGGELFDYLMLSKFSEVLARTYMNMMMEALAFAHSKGVAHRDLKPENLLLDSQYGLRIADWGLSAVVDDVDTALLRTQCGTRAYMAPEVLRREAYRGEAADVWSAGVVLFICLAGFPPFESATPGDWWFDRCAAGQHPLFWQAHERSAAFSPAAKDLLNGIFVTDPRARNGVEDVLKHPWMRGEAAGPTALRVEMHGRRARINASKGLPPPAPLPGAAAEEDEDAEGLLPGAGAAGAAAMREDSMSGGGGDVSMASSGASTSTGGVSGGSGAAGGALLGAAALGLGLGAAAGAAAATLGDPFARTTTRGLGGPMAVALPSRNPTLGPPRDAPVEVVPVASAGLSGLLLKSTAATAAAPADVIARYAAAASGIAIPEDAIAEPLQAAATLESHRATSFATRQGGAEVTPARLATALAGYLQTSVHATVAAKVHAGGVGGGGGGGIKLKVAVPAPLAPLRCEVKLFAAAAGGGYVVEFQRTGGDSLAFNGLFARVAAAFASVADPRTT